jgi:hypothetical protein
VSFLPLIVGTTALVAVAAAPLSIELIVQPRATADHDGNVVVRGLLSCSIETTVGLEVDLFEPLHRSNVASGQSATDVACDTTLTPWATVVTPDTDQSFRPGFATVAVRAVGFDPETGIFTGVETFGFVHLTRSAR